MAENIRGRRLDNTGFYQRQLIHRAEQEVAGDEILDELISESSVTQHEAALTIIEGQITDSTLLARVADNETITGNWTFDTGLNGYTDMVIGPAVAGPGDAAQGRLRIHGEDTAAIGYLQLTHTGLNAQLNSSAGGMQIWSASKVTQFITNQKVRIQGLTGSFYGQFHHDDTDFNMTFVGTTDLNITGLTDITLDCTVDGRDIATDGAKLDSAGQIATFYDSTGSQTLTTTPADINLDATSLNTATGNFSLATDVITVADAGNYKISYHVKVALATGTRDTANFQLERNSGGGYAAITGTESGAYGRIAAEVNSTSIPPFALALTAGDTIKLTGTATAANAMTTSVAFVTIEKIP